jgi:hypothetical protein
MVILPHRRKAFRTVPQSGGGGDSDPNFANVSALLHMQGANNGTTFIDSSLNALTCTAFGNAKTITSDFKWGNSCGNFDGSGDYLTIAASSGMDFGTGNYTVEMWAKWTSVGGAQILVDIGNGTTYLRIDGGNTAYIFDSGAFVIFAASIPTLSTETWYYIALVRSGNVRSLYVDGTLVASGTRVGTAGSAGISTKVGARFDSALAFNGKMQDLRITKGVARDVTSVPTSQFPDS